MNDQPPASDRPASDGVTRDRLRQTASEGSPPPPRVAVILGAGGTIGGLFIDGAVEQLWHEAGFRVGQATTLIGTSVGAFRVASAEELPGPGNIDRLGALSNGHAWRRRATDRPLTRIRLGAGRILAMLTPSGRPRADYRVPGPPYHRGGHAVSVAKSTGRRSVHRLVDAADPHAVISASAAVPFAVAPVPVEGTPHLDGAVHSPINADLCSPYDFDAIVVIAPMLAASGPNPLARLHRAQLRHELHRWTEDRTKIVIVITPSSRLTPGHDGQSMESGRAVVRTLIDRLAR